jgi:hypothetical protein
MMATNDLYKVLERRIDTAYSPEKGEDPVSASTESAVTSTAQVTQQADPRRWWALVAVSLATFMTYLDKYATLST